MQKLNFQFARVVLTAVAFSLPLLANADVVCTGAISYLGTDQNGQLFVAAGTNIHAICNSVTQGSWQASTQSCKQFYAMLMADQLAGRNVTIYYNGGALTQCSQITAWSQQTGTYFVATQN